MSRFWSKVERRGPDECWPWKGGRNSTEPGRDYGRVKYHGKSKLTHRVAWELTHGQAPSLQVLHSCDNPPCCNPAHLFLGTHGDNMADKARKSRVISNGTPPLMLGESNPQAKLTTANVRAIRSDRRPLKVIAAEYGVSNVLISKIRRRLAWRHV